MTDKRYQVFVSSTYKDLVAERQQVTEQLLRIRCIPSGMELFTASGLPPWDVIASALDTTDYMILVLAGRYGSSMVDDGRSYTEREYDYAVSLGIPVLAFLHEAPKDLSSKHVDTGEAAEKLEAFQTKVRDSGRHTVEFWRDGRELAQKVVAAIPQVFQTQPRPGWTRGGTDTGDNEGNRGPLTATEAPSDELAAARSEVDRRLLMERLGDWTPGSGFFRWLTDEVNHKYFPHTWWDEMHQKLAAWNSDARRLNDPDLERRFSEAVAALDLYYGRVVYYLHTIDNKPGRDGYSSVPAEWSSTQPRQHRQAFADLDEGRARLIAALNGVYQAAHERGIDLSQTPRSAPTSR